MRAILYSPTDKTLITFVHELLSHSLECPGCHEHMTNSDEGRELTARMIDALNDMTSEDITSPEEAVGFCEAWFVLHKLVSGIDLLEAVPINAKPN